MSTAARPSASGEQKPVDFALEYFMDTLVPAQESEELQSTADMTKFVQNLLNQMQARFQAMSQSIVTKIDEMGSRIDELEQSINELKTEMGADSPATKSKSEE